jgi:SAM-dependent methyltransferase
MGTDTEALFDTNSQARSTAEAGEATCFRDPKILCYSCNAQYHFGRSSRLLPSGPLAPTRNQPMPCKICGNEIDNREFQVREMMFGYRDVFTYVLCGACRCLQIKNPPANLSRYYPPEYYAFHAPPRGNVLRTLLVRLRDHYALFGTGVLGKVLFAHHPHAALRALLPLRPAPELHVLDVGCGAGAFLLALRRLGFERLQGVDPFIDADKEYRCGVTIFKKHLEDMVGSWDLMTFNHSFEHVPNPEDTLRTASTRLNPGGCCIIRIPTSSSYAWEHYGVNWVQLDAPRHYFLHSVDSIRILATRAGLQVEAVVWDSTALQFWGSEQYLRDVPLRDPRSVGENPRTTLFSKADLRGFASQAERLNREGAGDQAVFYLRKPRG